MASYLDRLRNEVNEARVVGFTIGAVLVSDLSRLLHDRDDLDAENDELRRENERLLKALAPTIAPPPMATDQCACGRPRIGCAYHG